MVTKYPAQIDTVITLPTVIDKITPMKGSTVNVLRDAILAIQGELGTHPAGANTTVSARLDILQGLIGNVPGIGVIESFTGPILTEVGAVVAGPIFTATYQLNATPSSAILSDNDANPSTNVSSHPFSFASPFAYQKNTYGATVVFTLTAVVNNATSTATSTLTWGQNAFFGVGATGSSGASFIQSLNKSLIGITNLVFEVNAGVGQKIFFAWRTNNGTPTFTISGFEGGFFTSSSTNITNQFGITENYTLYESDFANLGDTTILVSQ